MSNRGNPPAGRQQQDGRRLGIDRVRGRGGVGLGLAIVRSIVTAHQGPIRGRPRPEGGLELEVGLPGARAAPS